MQDVQLNVSFVFLLPFDISALVLRGSSCNLRKKLAICNLQFSGKETYRSQKWQNFCSQDRVPFLFDPIRIVLTMVEVLGG